MSAGADADYWLTAYHLSEFSTEKEISLWRNGLKQRQDLQANHIADEPSPGRTASAIGR
ncbi:hypothetical protein ACLB1N_25090 [Escherichia coli]